MTNDSTDPFEQLDSSDIDEPDELEELFAESSVEDLDSDSVWEELEESESIGVDEETATAAIHVVPKRAFCQECPHLDEPPNVRCTHEGTEILEFPDNDHVKVRNCPIVEKRGGATEAE